MLRIEGLTAGYSAIPVLNGVSIKVEEGQFVAIVGPNGAGKTTLFKTISGIVRPSSGAIVFEGTDLLSVRPAQRAHLGIAHVPEGRQVFPSLTVMENLEMGAVTEAGQRECRLDQGWRDRPRLPMGKGASFREHRREQSAIRCGHTRSPLMCCHRQ